MDHLNGDNERNDDQQKSNEEKEAKLARILPYLDLEVKQRALQFTYPGEGQGENAEDMKLVGEDKKSEVEGKNDDEVDDGDHSAPVEDEDGAPPAKTAGQQ